MYVNLAFQTNLVHLNKLVSYNYSFEIYALLNYFITTMNMLTSFKTIYKNHRIH